MNILVLLVVLVSLYLLVNERENFYSYYMPSNCIENVFGKINCYPPYYLPFYTWNYYW